MERFLDREERLTPSFTDQLHIYRARAVSKMDPLDDRLQVRIIPHMIDIENTEALPKWPSFFKGQVIVSKTEKDDKKKADYVWVAALPDFTMGFVLGLANSYETTSTKFSNSYNYKDMLEGLIQRGVSLPDMDYKDMYVQYWNENYIEMVNIRHGDKYLIQSNGTMIAMLRNQIYMRVGGTDTNNANKFSAIRMSQQEINFVTDHFRVKANNVTLGNKGLYVTGMASPIPISVEGATLHPQTKIQV